MSPDYIDCLMAEAAIVANTTLMDLYSKSRFPEHTRPRFAIMWVANKKANLHHGYIAEKMSRERTTVVSGIMRAEELQKRDPNFRKLVLKLEAIPMKDHVEYFQDEAKEHRFRVSGSNGEIVATSEGYTRRQDAKRGLATLRRLVLPTPASPHMNVLDHGFVALRNLAGPTRRPWQDFDASDQDPPQAARMSFDQMDSLRTGEEDHKLATYLMKNWHTSPFEMIQVWLEMKMPIFCARQFVRHRTVRLNEVSARYVTMPEEWYVPDVAHVGGKPKNAKQGRDDDMLDEPTRRQFIRDLDQDCAAGYRKYLFHLEAGVASELARCFLHVNHYTHWLWNQDLHNLFHMMKLRDHGHAQYEAQQYAKATDSLVRQYLPKSFELYDEYRRTKDKRQAGWKLEHAEHDSEIVAYNPHSEPLTEADRAAGWTALPLFFGD